MTQSLGSTKERIAQAFYVVGGLISASMLVFCAGFLMTIIDNWQRPSITASLAKNNATEALIFACLAYGGGWGLRWIISGTSTSIIDYFRDPLRIGMNPFVIATFAVIILFSIIMPFLGHTITSGPPSAQIYEGLGHSLAVLILSCVGLLHKTDRPHGFFWAALFFSTLPIIALNFY